jgi:rubrerythrin
VAKKRVEGSTAAGAGSLARTPAPAGAPGFTRGSTSAVKARPLTFRTRADVLAFAIRREEDAARSYGEWAGQAVDAGLKALFLELQAEEFGHKKLLQETAEGKRLPFLGRAVTDLKLSDYLVDEPVTASSRAQDVLIFAARKEAKAAELYALLLSRSIAAEHKRLFQFLSQQEKAHKLKLEQEYEKYVLQEN